jgi:hypothetical protein
MKRPTRHLATRDHVKVASKIQEYARLRRSIRRRTSATKIRRWGRWWTSARRWTSIRCTASTHAWIIPQTSASALREPSHRTSSTGKATTPTTAQAARKATPSSLSCFPNNGRRLSYGLSHALGRRASVLSPMFYSGSWENGIHQLAIEVKSRLATVYGKRT